jgi:hypothetical protein
MELLDFNVLFVLQTQQIYVLKKNLLYLKTFFFKLRLKTGIEIEL